MYTNIRSIMNNSKKEDLQQRLGELKVDILGITESWGNEGVSNAELSFKGYSLFRKDRGKGEVGCFFI